MASVRTQLTKRWATWIVVGLAVASAASVAALAVGPPSGAARRPGSWAVHGPLMTANLPVTLCPTHLGAAVSDGHRLPHYRLAVVSRRLEPSLATFTDALGTLDVVAPSTWQCTALDGVAGLSTLVVYPPGQARPPWGDVAVVRQGIVATQSGGCGGCSLEIACSLFATARHRYLATYGVACQHEAARRELVARVSPSLTRFIDPPGVAGTGRPSGGLDAAYGAMLWHPRRGVADTRAWLITCTLPSDDHDLCVFSVGAFVSRRR